MVMHIPCIKVLVTGAQYMQASLPYLPYSIFYRKPYRRIYRGLL